MAVYSVLLCPKDVSAFIQGDIIAVRKHPWTWGRQERMRFLIITIDVPSALDDKHMDMLSHYRVQFGYMHQRPTTEDSINPIIEKRRFNIPFAGIQVRWPALYAQIDFEQLQDPKVDYQPLERTVLTITGVTASNFFKDKTLDRTMTAADLTSFAGVL